MLGRNMPGGKTDDQANDAPGLCTRVAKWASVPDTKRAILANARGMVALDPTFQARNRIA